MPRLQQLEGQPRDGYKRCPRCDQVQPVDNFYANPARPDGISVLCRACHNRMVQAGQRRRREEAIAALGGICVECGYSDFRALQIDHINSDGSSARKNGEGDTVRRVLRGQVEGLQILCANCNVIKRLESREFRPLATYRRRKPTPRTFKGWSERQAPSEEHKQAIADGLKRAYAEGRRKRGHSEETKRKISETKRRKRQG